MKDYKVDAELQAFVDGDSGDSELAESEAGPIPTAKEELKQSLLDLGTRPVVMPIIIAINLAVFVAMLASGVSVMTPQIIELVDWGANVAGLTLSGDWWRLGTSMFLHIGIFHIAMNMIVLWDGGRIVERMIGHWAFLAMYLTSGLVGSVVSLMWNDNVVSAGASGAVFGVFGCLLALLIRDRTLLPTSVRNRLAKGAVFFMGYNFLFGMGSKGIDMGAHVGGFAAGVVCGFLVELGTRRERSGTRTGVVAALGVVAILLAVTVLPKASQRQYIDRDQMMKFGNNEVFYSDGATALEAQATGAALVESLYFRDNQRASVLISKDKNLYVVGLVLAAEIPDDPIFLTSVRNIGGILSGRAFAGNKVRMELLNAELDLLKALEPVDAQSNPPMSILADGEWNVAYSDGATLEDAKVLKKVLVDVGFFRIGQRSDVFLSKAGGIYVAGIILGDPSVAADPSVASEIIEIAKSISQGLGGLDVVIRLLDANSVVLKEFPAENSQAVP